MTYDINYELLEESEVIKPIKGFDNYYISNYGNVYSNNKRKFHKQTPAKLKGGYWIVYIRNNEGKYKTQYIHRLVAEAFCPKPELTIQDVEVNHIDRNKANNRADNLEWTTHRSNVYWNSSKPVTCEYGSFISIHYAASILGISAARIYQVIDTGKDINGIHFNYITQD